MDFDEYSQKIAAIHHQLQDIADRTLRQAFVGAADPSNPAFVDLMHKHTQLVKLSSELTERMAALMDGQQNKP